MLIMLIMIIIIIGGASLPVLLPRRLQLIKKPSAA